MIGTDNDFEIIIKLRETPKLIEKEITKESLYFVVQKKDKNII